MVDLKELWTDADASVTVRYDCEWRRETIRRSRRTSGNEFVRRIL